MLIQCYLDAGNDHFQSIVTYSSYLSAWYSYITLLDIDYTEGFMCSQCGHCPDLVVMDATALSFRKELDYWGKVKREMTVDVVARKSK